MRRYGFGLLLSCLALPALSLGQTTSTVSNSTVDASVRQWLSSLSLEPMLYLSLQATESQGKLAPATPQLFAWFKSDTVTTSAGPRSTLQVKILYYENYRQSQSAPVPTTLLIGDGVNFYVYDYQHQSYFSLNYGSYQGLQPSNYNSNFFRYLQGITSSYMGDVATLLSQTYSAGGLTYQSWIPSSRAFFDTLGNANYTIGNPPSRNLIFVSGQDPNNSNLTIVNQVQWDDIVTRGGFNMSTVWTMDVTPLTAIDETIFKFVPPIGSRVVTAPKLLLH